ncbi:MAG TPA: sulfatase-like hydrolase/transferase, partial [Thermoanaerobaculia bacterium]
MRRTAPSAVGAVGLPALAGLVIAGGLVAAGCGGRSGNVFEKAPIVVISIDTLRSDHLPMYGYKQVDTPALDRFRKDALLCERAFSHYPMTLPSHLSILSGLLPPEHGVRDNSGYTFDAAAHPYLPALLKAAGYETGAAVSSFVLRKASGIASGFDFYDDDLHPTRDKGLDAVQRPGAQTAKLALDWLRPRAGRPFFLLLHLYEPHFPYEPPEPYASRYKSHYDGEIATADAVVGDFLGELKRLGVYDKAIVVVLSDHGEGLGDHGEEQHSIFVYREDLQVPLLLKLPGSRQGGGTIHGVAQLVDVAPTLLALVGLPRPKELTGASLLDLAAGRVPGDREIYSESYYPRLHFGWSELTSLVRGPFHYIEAPEPELYDDPSDPAERRNVLADNRRVYASLRDSMAGRRRPLAAPSEIDAETSAKMASLGYVAGGSALAKGALADPKSKRAILSDLQDAYTLANAGRHREAVEIFRRALAQDPGMVNIWALLAVSLDRLGEKEQAAQAYEKALAASGGSPQFALAAARLLLESGRLDDAGKRAELAVKADPKQAYELLVRIALRRGDGQGALAVFQRAVAAQAEPPGARRELAVALSSDGKSAQALELLAPLGQADDPPTLCAL